MKINVHKNNFYLLENLFIGIVCCVLTLKQFTTVNHVSSF